MGEPAMGILDSINELQGLFRETGAAGITDEDWARLRADEAFRKRIAASIRTGGCDSASHGNEPYAGLGCAPDFQVFGLPEWQAFCRVESSYSLFRTQKSFPWVGEHTLLEQDCPFFPGHKLLQTHFCFLIPAGIEHQHMVYDHEPMRLDLLGVNQLFESWVNWRKRPHLDLMDDLKRQPELRDQLTPAPQQWCMMPLVPFAGGLDEIPPEYEPATSAEYLLGLGLYYQKFGRLPKFGGVSGFECSVSCADTLLVDGHKTPIVVQGRPDYWLYVLRNDHYQQLATRRLRLAIKRRLPTS